MDSRAQRAARRRAEWQAEVTSGKQPKRGLYASLTGEQRLAALARLNDRAWRAAGGETRSTGPRSAWPGEVFEIAHRG